MISPAARNSACSYALRPVQVDPALVARLKEQYPDKPDAWIQELARLKTRYPGESMTAAQQREYLTEIFD